VQLLEDDITWDGFTIPHRRARPEEQVQHAELLGIDVSASAVHEYEVRGNRALANGQVGIHLGPLADDAQVTGNVALGNGGADGFDCQDESDGEGPTDGTAGTENTWQDNVGVRADPAGICAAPTTTDQPVGHGHGHGHGKDHGKRWGHKQHHRHHKQHHEHGKPRPDPCECSTLPWRF